MIFTEEKLKQRLSEESNERVTKIHEYLLNVFFFQD